jgi:hypothetical protein
VIPFPLVSDLLRSAYGRTDIIPADIYKSAPVDNIALGALEIISKVNSNYSKALHLFPKYYAGILSLIFCSFKSFILISLLHEGIE